MLAGGNFEDRGAGFFNFLVQPGAQNLVRKTSAFFGLLKSECTGRPQKHGRFSYKVLGRSLSRALRGSDNLWGHFSSLPAAGLRAILGSFLVPPVVRAEGLFEVSQ